MAALVGPGMKGETLLDDTVYYPNWLQTLGYDVDEITKQIEAITLADRAARHMKYCGKPLPRSKFFYVDSLEKVPVYNYPGHQWRTVTEEYRLIESCPIIHSL